MRVDIWSDVVCPWCYVGKRRFERALERFDHRAEVDVVYRSFQLDPGSPPGQVMDRRAMLMKKYGWSDAQADDMDARMTRTAAAEGLAYRLAGGVTGNTLDAHRVVHLARVRGVQEPVVERLFRAHFVERRSIFDHASLAGLADEAGLGAAEVSGVLASTAYADDVRRDAGEARTLGIAGVPFFLIAGRLGVSGAQQVEVMLDALERGWNEVSAGGAA